ncbi:sensor histidine kinase [Spirosoma migulaei]
MKCSYYLWVFLLLTGVVNAQLIRQPLGVAPVQFDATGKVSLQNHLFHLVESTGQLSIQQVIERQRMDQFQPLISLTDRQDFGYNTTDTHWLFFTLQNPATAQQTRLMLEIEYANIDDLQLFEVSGDSIQTAGPTGDRFRYAQRPYQNNNYVFPITLRAGQQTGYYLRVKQPYAILSFSMQLWNRPVFVASDRTEYFFWGIYVGIICIVLVLNLVMLLALRDWIYVWYSLYLHFITMHLFSDSGLGFQYLWPNVPYLNEFSPVYLYIWAAMVAQTTFMQYFIHQNRRNSRMYRWVNAFRILVTTALAASIAVHWLQITGRETYMYRLESLGTTCFVPMMALLMMLSLYEKSRTKHADEKVVRYYRYALTVQFSGYVLVAFMNFCQGRGWSLPFDVETYALMGMSVLIDLVFFTLGLTYRYKQAQEKNQQLELELLTNQQMAQSQLITSLEVERQRLAQDLHDDVGPLLATAKGYLSRLFRTEPSPPLTQAQSLIDEAADELRTLSHQLLPRHNVEQPLADAIAEVCRKLGRHGVPVRFMSLGEARPMDEPREQLLFSLATQLIRNARQHPQATEVLVQLLYHEEQVNLSVEDDGGPALSSVTTIDHLRAKAELLKAELLIDSTETGNSVMVSVLMLNPAQV